MGASESRDGEGSVVVRECSPKARWGSILHTLCDAANFTRRAHDTLSAVAKCDVTRHESARLAAAELRKAHAAILAAHRIANSVAPQGSVPPPHKPIGSLGVVDDGGDPDPDKCGRKA